MLMKNICNNIILFNIFIEEALSDLTNIPDRFQSSVNNALSRGDNVFIFLAHS